MGAEDLDFLSTENPNFVTVSALPGGRLTLAERLFIHPADPQASKTVPSLSFLITHVSPHEEHTTRILFDLGIRSERTEYIEPIQNHMKNREPLFTSPNVLEVVTANDLKIDLVLLSHVHWDHIGDARKFGPPTRFIVGHGSRRLLSHGIPDGGSHSHFEPDLLPHDDRCIELLPSNSLDALQFDGKAGDKGTWRWKPLGPGLPNAIDLFADGSVYIVDAPGHLPGHTNLLVRLNPRKWAYLGGDACHDLRILRGEREIGTWNTDEGKEMCIHLDKAAAEATIEGIRRLERYVAGKGCSLEIILAHDYAWADDNASCFFPGQIR